MSNMSPGGPRPKQQVHRVGPGPEIRPGYVLTPGGYRHQSVIYGVENGLALRMSEGHMQKVGSSGEVVTDYGPLQAPPSAGYEPGALGDGWIAFAFFSNLSGQPVSSFRTTWVVPPDPQTQSGQLIFLFNGMRRFEPPKLILQPVLQWGLSPAGGGKYWSVASWLVTGDQGPAWHSDLVKVDPGTGLTGVMTLIGEDAGLFNYTCLFEGIPGASLLILSTPEFTQCVETLEAHSLTRCNDYPAAIKTEMSAITILTGSTAPPLTWDTLLAFNDCCQNVVVVSDSEVDLFYGWSPVQFPERTPIAVTSVSPDEIEVFLVADSGRPCTASWHGGPSWIGFSPVASGGFSQATPIAAIERDSNTIDLYAVGEDGGVYSAWWRGVDWSNWVQIGTRAFAQNTPVAAIARDFDSIDIYAVGEDGGVYTAWWRGTAWSDWARIGNGVFAQTTPVTAIGRGSEAIDLYAVGEDGRVYTAWWRGTDWSEWVHVGSAVLAQKSAVAAITRNSESIDLYATGEGGRVYTAWWRGTDWSDWASIRNGVFPMQTPVAAIARGSDSIDLYAVGEDGGVYTAWWRGTDWNDWVRIGDGTFAQNTPVAAIARGSDSIDLYAVGKDGGVYTAWWRGNGWEGWSKLDLLLLC